MAALYERVRPQDFDTVVGQDAIIRRLKSMEQRLALGGRAYWISGLSGTGKTTLAKIIASKVASEFATTEIPVKQLDAKALDDWECSTRMKCIDGRGHALIVNEAHGLKPNTIYQLLDVLERLRDYCVVIFTTTNEGQAAQRKNKRPTTKPTSNSSPKRGATMASLAKFGLTAESCLRKRAVPMPRRS